MIDGENHRITDIALTASSYWGDAMHGPHSSHLHTQQEGGVSARAWCADFAVDGAGTGWIQVRYTVISV